MINTAKATTLLVSIMVIFSCSPQEGAANDRAPEPIIQQKERPQGGPPTYAQLLKEMDTNKDGKLAKAEVKGPLKDDFAKIDTDEDGFISEAEFKKAPKPERGQRPSPKN